ncbi:tat twin-arginine translocation pathway signal sequence domain protein [Asticcacaulis biprosthecium C19]|uniref:Tat twin-arginine translocation pathway signal sequence domain protein n=1 Tax=Asticcacaulis biprosthecium C19 TaxID=715226 RepID=F4QJY0_9CAUL|nr:FecR domain-containing protein [Asticcacaulis biprosthecium]EGF93237.1 tat twin-arginine translocation pathway signal sequence domain protein [Asticcacaulis biprosthecium C19]
MPVETSEEIEIAASLWAVKERPLSPEDEVALRAWLSGDPRRRGALLRAQAGWAALSRAKALGPSEDWQVRPKPRANPSRRGLLAGGGIAAGLAAAALGGLFLLRKEEAVTTTGEIRRLPMSDGSIAAINTESRIRIEMTDAERKVDLVQGEVWFKVARNKARPFVVAAGDARIQAVGTAFSVRRHDSGAEVLVTEGTVKAWLEGDDRPAVWLKAGDRTVIGDRAAKVDHAPDAVDNALAWREGKIALAGKTLSAVAEDYNRYNQVKIVIRDAGLGNERLLGRFSTDDPEGFSDAVAQAFGAEITRTGSVIYIDVKKNATAATELRNPDIVP